MAPVKADTVSSFPNSSHDSRIFLKEVDLLETFCDGLWLLFGELIHFPLSHHLFVQVSLEWFLSLWTLLSIPVAFTWEFWKVRLKPWGCCLLIRCLLWVSLTTQPTQLGLDSLVSSSIALLTPPCLFSLAFIKMPPSLWSLAPLLPISWLPSHGLCLPSWEYGKITKRLPSRTFNYRTSAGLLDRFPFRSLDHLEASSQDLCSMLSQMAAPRGADDLSVLLSICV